MRKLFSLLFVFLLVIPVTACGQSNGEESGTVVDAEIIPVTDAAESAQETKTASDAADSGAETEEKTNMKAKFDFETKTVMLNSGYEMPLNGLGTYSLHGDECMNSVKSALSNGVRLIDTASAYGNEEEIGQAIREAIDEGIIQRKDIFVTTKIYPGSEMENPFDWTVELVCGGIDGVSPAGGYRPRAGPE